LVVISHALAERLRQRLPQLPCPLIVAHDGADAQPRRETRARSGRFTAGFVGRLYRGKGVELIAALAALCPWADFHIVGAAAAEAADVTGAPAPANVLFHGSIAHSQVAAIIAGWDVALAPYQRRVLVADGRTDAAPWMSPLKIFEYMAAGKAIVASDLPAIREILSDGVTALLRAPDAPESWAMALQELRARPERAAQFGLAARARFEAEHTWSQRARRILDAASAPAFSGSPRNTAETANV
jgi:glycosyltransferase involved in cell wall biosynthesis